MRTELLEKERQGHDLSPNILTKRIEFQLKLIADLDNPAHSPPHSSNMIFNPYDVKSILFWIDGQLRGSARFKAAFGDSSRVTGGRSVALYCHLRGDPVEKLRSPADLSLGVPGLILIIRQNPIFARG